MRLLRDILDSLPDGEVLDVRIGVHWTAVVVAVSGVHCCGLASTLMADHGHHDHRQSDIPRAGKLSTYSGRELAELSLLDQPIQASVGVAALNALVPHNPQTWMEANAEEVIAHHGKDKRVALVGDFPFVKRLRSRVGELVVLERDPGPQDLPADAAPLVIPQAEVVAITGMTLANHTLEDLLGLCSPQAFIIVLGPSTPLSPLLFDYGVDVISGSVVEDIEPVLQTVSQGGNFRQVHRAGVRLVNIVRSDLE